MSSSDDLNARVERIIRNYLERYLGTDKVGDAWTIGKSKVSGRGLRTTRDINPGEVIFWDRPVILGPRACGTAVCVGCHLGNDYLQQCPKGCKLPVCNAECAESQQHQNECTILAAYGSCDPHDSWSPELLHSLTAIRSLELKDADREVVRCLQANADSYFEKQIGTIKKFMAGNLNSEDEQWMSLCSRSMNTNAFETRKNIKGETEEREGSLRGLYPLAALLNHDCSPNTRHVYDEQCNMVVHASQFIPSGEEITTSYCSILWDTSSRRLHLARTKQFACACERCKDPTEFGTNLSGLPCPQEPCQGIIICSNPLLPHKSIWTCSECSVEIQMDQVHKLQKIQGLLLMGTDSSNPQSIINFLQLKKVPQNCVVEVQLKLGLCYQLGHTPGYKWEELSDDQLEIKERVCNELLELLVKLRTGESRVKGMVTFELHCCLCEQLRRLTQDNNNEVDENNTKRIKDVKEKITRTFQVASDIFENDATAPIQFRKKLNGSNLYENYE